MLGLPRNDLAAKALFFAAALPVVTVAAWRLAWWERRLQLEELAVTLRRVGHFRVRALRRPRYLLGTVNRLLPLLPPYRFGPCLKRSLLLADLWSRCGLDPQIHLSVRPSGPGAAEGHAWVTTSEGYSTSSNGFPEAFVL